MFQYAEADLNGLIDSGTITTLSPGPSYPEYPTRFLNDPQSSKDGNPIIQVPLADDRPRRWTWARYWGTVPGYTQLYSDLLQLQFNLRLKETPAKSEWVFLKEDVSNNWGKLEFSGGTWTLNEDFIRVKVIDVSQNVASHGGIVQYTDMYIEFLVDDSTFNVF